MAVCRVAEGVGPAVPPGPALAPPREEPRARLVRPPSSVPRLQAHRASVADEELERNEDEPQRKVRRHDARRAERPETLEAREHDPLDPEHAEPEGERDPQRDTVREHAQ